MQADELDLEARRAEKRAEASMAPSLKVLAMRAARERAALLERARVERLCECHPYTWLEAVEEAHLLDYGHAVARARDAVAVDIPTQLRRAGAPELHLTRIRQGGLDERPSLFAAKVWLGLAPERLGVQGKHAANLVRAQASPAHRRPYLAMLGTTDRGKTLAAVYALGAMMRRHPWNTGATGTTRSPPFAFVPFASFAGLLAWDEATRIWLEGLKSARCVVLDDMGKEHLGGPAQMMLFELLDSRYARGLDTIITSQLTVSQFQLKYDGAPTPDGKPGAIFRRLRERGLILRDGGDAGAVLMAGDTDVKKWPRKGGESA